MRENKHSAHDLAQMQSLPLKAKITLTKERIKQWYEHWDGNVYVSFSGGKDSTALKHIVDSMYDDVPALFVNTGLEYPEIQKFVKDVADGKYDCFNTDVTITRPKKRFDEVVRDEGYPVVGKEVARCLKYAKQGSKWALNKCQGKRVDSQGRKSLFNMNEKWLPFLHEGAPKISDRCCDIMKKEPAKQYEHDSGRKGILATMASESRLRKQAWQRTGCNAFNSNHPISKPMSFWTENDVLQYLKENNVPYASVYGEIVETGKQIENIIGTVPQLATTGCARTGCIFCMFGAHSRDDHRFTKLKETHPKQYEYCMKPVSEGGLGLKDVIDWTNENCGTKIEY